MSPQSNAAFGAGANIHESTQPDLSILINTTIEVERFHYNNPYREVMDHLMTIEGRNIRPNELKSYHWDFQPVFKAIGSSYVLKTSKGDAISNVSDLRCYLLSVTSGKHDLATDTYGNRCLHFTSHYWK